MHTHHSIDYVEIRVADIDAGKRFFAEALGWTFTDYGPDYAGIKGMADSEREVGGLAKGKPTPSGGPLVVLFSNDLEATLDAVKEAGGKIVRETFSFPGGRRFHFADPDGNEFGVWAEDS
jgi:predicted enzyme related to lactoylglutathione lyase